MMTPLLRAIWWALTGLLIGTVLALIMISCDGGGQAFRGKPEMTIKNGAA